MVSYLLINYNAVFFIIIDTKSFENLNSAVNIRKNNQTRPEAFKIPSFTTSCKKEVEKVRPS